LPNTARVQPPYSIAPPAPSAISSQQRQHGIEPSFAHLIRRNVIREGRKTKEKVDVLSYEYFAYRDWSIEGGP
jgi:ribonucleoside-diphosphate reductase alpha chain